MSRLRFQPVEWTTHFVTCRNLMGYLLMKPTKRINGLIAGCLAKSINHAKQRRGEVIKIHAFAFVSNHYHMIISSKSQRDLSSFMSHFNGCLGKELAIEHDLHGKIWHSRYKSSPILDPEALEDRYRYLLAHSVKEDLVTHPKDWPGLHAYKQLCLRQELKGIWVDRTALYIAKQRMNLKMNQGQPTPTEADFTTELTVALDGPPSMWEHLTDEEYRVLCERLVSEVVAEHRERRRRERKGVLGVQRILSQPIFEKRFTKRSPCPLCHTKLIELFREYKTAYWSFVGQFRAASYELRDALVERCETVLVTFPEGGVPLFGGG